MWIGAEGKQRVTPAEAALRMAEIADGRIDHHELLADVDLRPAFRPAAGEQQPQRIVMRFRLPNDTVEVEAAAIEQALEFRDDFLACLHLLQKREKLYEQRNVHGSPSR
ncbi:hypothetical protein D9M70_587420 [compost metagenome]